MFTGGWPRCTCPDGAPPSNGACRQPVDSSGKCIEGWVTCRGDSSKCCERQNCQTTTLFSPGYKLVSDGPVSFLNLTFPTHLVSQNCTKAFGRIPGTNRVGVYNVVDGSPVLYYNGGSGYFLSIYNDGTYNASYKKTNTVPNNYASLVLTDLGQLVVYNLSTFAELSRSLYITQLDPLSPLGMF